MCVCVWPCFNPSATHPGVCCQNGSVVPAGWLGSSNNEDSHAGCPTVRMVSPSQRFACMCTHTRPNAHSHKHTHVLTCVPTHSHIQTHDCKSNQGSESLVARTHKAWSIIALMVAGWDTHWTGLSIRTTFKCLSGARVLLNTSRGWIVRQARTNVKSTNVVLCLVLNCPFKSSWGLDCYVVHVFNLLNTMLIYFFIHRDIFIFVVGSYWYYVDNKS